MHYAMPCKTINQIKATGEKVAEQKDIDAIAAYFPAYNVAFWWMDKKHGIFIDA